MHRAKLILVTLYNPLNIYVSVLIHIYKDIDSQGSAWTGHGVERYQTLGVFRCTTRCWQNISVGVLNSGEEAEREQSRHGEREGYLCISRHFESHCNGTQ